MQDGHLPPSQGDLYSMLSPRNVGDEFVSAELSDDITPPTEHSSSSHSMLPPRNLGEEFVSVELSGNITTTIEHSSSPHSMLPPRNLGEAVQFTESISTPADYSSSSQNDQ